MGYASVTTSKQVLAPDLEQHWLDRARRIPPAELETSLLLDLRKALLAAENGHLEVVEVWLDRVEELFLLQWDEYESGDILEDEITAESVLGHRMLRSGVEGWLEVVQEFRDQLLSEAALETESLLWQAQEAQRCLLLIGLMEAEQVDPVQAFLLAWSN